MSERSAGLGGGLHFNQLSDAAKRKARDHWRATQSSAGGGQGAAASDAEVDQALLRAGTRFDDDGEECE